MLALLCDHVLEGDVDALDSLGRSALFLACVEGKTEQGISDATALADCIDVLAEMHVDMNIQVPGAKACPIHYLTGSWQDAPLRALLRAGGNIHAMSVDGSSALHVACTGRSLRKSTVEVTRLLFGEGDGAALGGEDGALDGVVDREGCLRTLELLLRAGARPNVKVCILSIYTSLYCYLLSNNVLSCPVL